jgi:predicted phage baseplate assembly protein
VSVSRPTPAAQGAALDSCGCCEVPSGTSEISNPPGQSVLAYRIGTHAALLRRMITRLPRWRVPGESERRPLANLSSRTADDPAIALLDGWATIGDVLTFYNERIANEGFLRTATERRSILELARAIGYELAPGVAAAAHLVFTVDDSDLTPDEAEIPAGTQVQSVPSANDELPQTFETSQAFEARVAWNAIRARQGRSQKVASGLNRLYLEGVDTRLEPGDPILLVGEERIARPGSERWDVRFVKTVETVADESRSYTLVTWEPGLGHDALRVLPADNPTVYALRLRAAIFGHNTPDFRAMPKSIKEAYGNENGVQWPDFDLQHTDESTIFLDAVYEGILQGSWVALARPAYTELYRVLTAEVDSRTDFTLTAKVTRLKFDTNEHLSWFSRRRTAVYAESEALVLAREPIEDPIEGDVVDLDEEIAGLELGHALVFAGELAGSATEAAEVAFLDRALRITDGTRVYTRLELTEPLANRYLRTSVRIHANIMHATHGETVTDEVVGSGDASRAHQRFVLKKAPLTYVSAATASGVESTLTLRVDGVEWAARASLFGLGPTDRAYTVRIDNEAATAVVFGDGNAGARLPTGQENVRATYRSGLGVAGIVRANSLILLKSRPQGIKAVRNPVAAAGGEDPEHLDAARRNAPVTVLTLDRVVSLRDFEDFARTFAGIGKASASGLQVGETQLVHVTIAASNGTEIAPTTDLYRNLFDAIDAARDPLTEFRLASFERRLFRVAAELVTDAAHQWEAVRAGIVSALLGAFSFESREFGAPVSAAEVITTMQGVAGVVAVDLNELYLIDDNGTRVGELLATVLVAAIARPNPAPAPGGPDTLPAEILMIDPAGISLAQQSEEAIP